VLAPEVKLTDISGMCCIVNGLHCTVFNSLGFETRLHVGWVIQIRDSRLV